MILILAASIALCAIALLINPNLINPLSEEDRKRMDRKRVGRYAFGGLIATAAVLVVLYICGIRNDIVPIFVIIPGVLVTVTLIQCSLPKQ